MNNIKQLQMTQVVEAPVTTYRPTKYKLFLAGGISNCPDWQSKVIDELSGHSNLTIFNPRRADFPIGDPKVSKAQISWEYEHLKASNIIIVWFSKGSINPIVLYELGKWVNARPDVPAFIGIDPGYERAEDVLIQTQLARPEITVVDSLDKLIAQVQSALLI